MNNFSLDDFFAAFKGLRTGSSQSCTGGQSVQRGCCGNQGYLSNQTFDMPDKDVMFDESCSCHQMPVFDDGCNCNQQVPQRGCGNRFTEQFRSEVNLNSGIVDGCGNDIYDGPGNDVYSMGNSGIIDTNGNDIYAQNYSINTFNTINNFWAPQASSSPEPTTPDPTVPDPTPPDPTASPTPDAINLTPLRNLLTGMEKLKPDGVLSDEELNKAMVNPHYADLDGDVSSISSEEMAIFNEIKALNEDKDLISDVMKGNYSNISDTQLTKLGEISAAIQNLTQNR